MLVLEILRVEQSDLWTIKSVP